MFAMGKDIKQSLKSLMEKKEKTPKVPKDKPTKNESTSDSKLKIYLLQVRI